MFLSQVNTSNMDRYDNEESTSPYHSNSIQILEKS